MLGRYASELLLIAVGALSALGLVVLFSISELSTGGNGAGAFQRQLIWLGCGVFVACLGALVDYRWWMRFRWPLFWGALFLLTLCFAPYIGREVNGANRWIWGRQFGLPAAVQFQPSEFARLAGIIWLAAWYHHWTEWTQTFWRGFAVPGLCMAMMIGLIAIEIDLGSAAVLSFTTGVVMLMAGVRFRWLILAASAAVGSLIMAIMNMPERVGRLLAFLDPQKYPKDAFQQEQAKLALSCGGWHGLGLGNRSAFVPNLPEADTDFIFAVAGGELGLQVSLLIVLAFVVIMVCGMIIALRAPDRMGMLLGAGIVSLIVIQAIVNMGVVSGALPNKGLALPFVSRGGTNLIACLFGVGVLLSIHRQSWREGSYFTVPLTRMRITPAV